MTRLVCPYCEVPIRMFNAPDKTPYAFCETCYRAWNRYGIKIELE